MGLEGFEERDDVCLLCASALEVEVGGAFLNHFYPLLPLNAGSLTEPWAHWLLRLTGQQASNCLRNPNAGTPGVCYNI